MFQAFEACTSRKYGRSVLFLCMMMCVCNNLDDQVSGKPFHSSNFALFEFEHNLIGYILVHRNLRCAKVAYGMKKWFKWPLLCLTLVCVMVCRF